MMSREGVGERVREAWDTLRRVPAHGVMGFKCQWPNVVQDAVDAYGYTAVVVRLSPASPQAIDRMNETFGWFRFLKGQRDLTAAMWMTCGCGMGTRRAGAILGVHRNTIANHRNAALDLIINGLARESLANVRIVPHCAVSTIASGVSRAVR